MEKQEAEFQRWTAKRKAAVMCYAKGVGRLRRFQDQAAGIIKPVFAPVRVQWASATDARAATPGREGRP
jgi:hypothetical protein